MKTKNKVLLWGALIAIPLAIAFAAGSTQKVNNLKDGLYIGGTTTDKIGFYKLTGAITRPAGVAQTPLPTPRPGVGTETVTLPVTLAAIAAPGDLLTAYMPGHKFKLLGVSFITKDPATTADKAVTLGLKINATAVTGGAIALATVDADTLGEVKAGTAITALNSGTATDTITVVASAVTAFVEGEGYLLIKVQNMDTLDQITAETDGVNAVIDALVALGLIKGGA